MKVYVDRTNRLEKNLQATLTDDDFVGQATITSAWREGYGSMTTLDANKIKK